VNNQELIAYFRGAAADIDSAMENDLSGAEVELLMKVLRHAIFNGGKRIRPQLTIVCCNLVSAGLAVDPRKLLELSISFEYLHAASLLHDDVIDNAEKRRGQPSANVVWGVSPVILAGDYLHSRSLTLAGQAGGVACVMLAGRATAAMVEAEFLQKQTVAKMDFAEENYNKIVAGKTGALIASACEAGVIIAGGTQKQREQVRLYGESIGMAFQVIDDLLDYQGNPERTGKAVGNDLLEGKMTLPVIYAFRDASEGERIRLREILGLPDNERLACLAEVTEMIESHDGFGKARRRAEICIVEGLQAIEDFKGGREYEILVGLAGYVLSRDK